jgi:hypothetical protein
VISRRAKGAHLGPRQNCRRVEGRKRAARSSDCSARGIGLAEGCQKDESRRSATGRAQKKKARRHHSGGQKAAVIGDEETLGRAPQKIVLTGDEANSGERSPAPILGVFVQNRQSPSSSMMDFATGLPSASRLARGASCSDTGQSAVVRALPLGDPQMFATKRSQLVTISFNRFR